MQEQCGIVKVGGLQISPAVFVVSWIEPAIRFVAKGRTSSEVVIDGGDEGECQIIQGVSDA